jgi:hypothetical protein
MAGGYTENPLAAAVRANYSDSDLISELIARVLLGNITIPVSGGTSGGLTDVEGNVAAGSPDTGNPVKVGGIYKAAPHINSSGSRVDALFDAFGRQLIALGSIELNTTVGLTSLRDLQTSQRYSVLYDSVADGFATFWSLSSAGSGTNPVVGSGEGVLDPGLGASGNSLMSSVIVKYLPGQSAWLNSAVRMDAGVAGNTRIVGPVTMSGTAPQDGFCFELVGTTLYASVYKGGVATRTDSTAWSRVADSPFTLDTNYHSYECRFTANGVQFYVDNVVRHAVAGTSTAITASLNFPMTLASVNNAGLASNAKLYIRNIGMGRFGTPPSEYTNGETRPSQAGANGVLTFTFASPVDLVWVSDTGATTTNYSYVDAFGGTPASGQGAVLPNGGSIPVMVTPPSTTVKVWSPVGSTISMYGQRYI